MTKVSPHYRDDTSEGLPAEIRTYLDKHFLQKLENLEVSHPKLLVVFLGGNAVGKSTLSQHIKTKLHALVLENDRIKANLLKFDPNLTKDQLNVLTWQYSIDLYKRLDQLTPNGLVVRDGVIHWYHDRILPIFRERGYNIFIIDYDLSRAKRIELIQKRGDKLTTNVDRLLLIMKDHDILMKRFRALYTADVVLNDDNLFDYELVIAKIQDRLRQLEATA